MEQIEANNEILYRLSKMMLINLVKNGYLEKEEAEKIRLSIQDTLSPVIGCLEDTVDYE